MTVQFPYRAHNELTTAKWKGVAGFINLPVVTGSFPVLGFVIDFVILILFNPAALPTYPAWGPLLL